MKGMREIRNRIKAIKSTGQITHAMELVAASKMKKAQRNAEAGRVYAALLADITDIVADETGLAFNKSMFGNLDCKTRLIIVFSTSKGLCGALNTNLFKKIASLEGDIKFVAVGSKALKFLMRTKRDIATSFQIGDSVGFSEIRKITDYALKLAAEGKIGSIEVLYSLYINTLKQEPTLVKLAPMDNLDWYIERMRKQYKLVDQPKPEDSREFTFEPCAKEIMDELPKYFLRQTMHHMALDAKASEQSARMVAMKSASDNADSLVDSLTLEYNKARQSAITTEIQELAAAAAQTSQD